MRRLAALAFLCLLPAVQAGLVATDHPFQVTLPYATKETDSVGIVSGALSVRASEANVAFILSETSAFTITGITQACWTADSNVQSCQAGAFTLAVDKGSTFGLQSPKPFPIAVTSPQGLAAPADQQFTHDVSAAGKAFRVASGQSLVVASTDLLVHAEETLELPKSPTPQGIRQDNSLGVSGASNSTRYALRSGASTLATFTGMGKSALLQGSLVLQDLRPTAAVLPAGGLEFTIRTADHLDIARQLRALSEGVGAFSDPLPVPDLAAFGEALSELGRGFILRAPAHATAQELLRGIDLMRFSDARATLTDEGVRLQGSGFLVLQHGAVQGAEPLYGLSFLQLPWWSYVLWGLALVAFIVRLALGRRIPKPNQTRWHRLRWIGRVAGPLALAGVLWMWDLEVQAVLGTSVLAALGQGASWEVVAGLAAVEFGLFALMSFAVISPLALLFRSSFRLARQGTFMNLSGTLATLLSMLLGFPLLLSYLDYLLRQAAGA